MRVLWRTLMALVVACGTVAVVGSAHAATNEVDIRERLAAVPGMRVLSEDEVPGVFRFFTLAYRQYVDHRHPEAGTFEQRLTLLHRDTTKPMVLHTTGYQVPSIPFRAEPTRLVDGNQISVEQRFFTPSRPDSADWTKLTVWQAATDHHRLVTALKPIYPARWLSTGASKGGMTSVYHRRFYPGDVDGTVAYVAPQDTVEFEDSRYDRFFDTVGSDPSCQNRLEAAQRAALTHRAELVDRYAAWAAENGQTFTTIGGVDRAFEFMVNGVSWAFWQYNLEDNCVTVPAADASTDALWEWLDVAYGYASNTDAGIEPFVPYYFQAATQLGYPQLKLPELADLQRYRGQDTARSYVPRDLPVRFQPVAMADIDLWVRTQGRQLLFVYGQNDPWGAEPFKLGPGTKDSLWYEAHGANHGANIAALTAGEQSTASEAVRRWAGITTAAPPAVSSLSAAAPSYIPALDDYNPALDRRFSR